MNKIIIFYINVIHVRYVVVNYIITIFGNHIICRNILFLQTGTTKYLLLFYIEYIKNLI